MKRQATAILHPAAVLRQNRYGMEPAQVEYLRRLRLGHVPASLSVPPGFVAEPTLADLDAFWDHLQAQADRTTTADLECAGSHLICVGIWHEPTQRGVLVRFRRRLGRGYWPTRSHLIQAIQWLDDYLTDPTLPKVFHNGQAFDIPYLEQFGFGPVHGYVMDTLLLQRFLYPEMPADLQFVAGLYAGFPPWKYMTKGMEGEDAGK